jgi:hypothetical protein
MTRRIGFALTLAFTFALAAVAPAVARADVPVHVRIIKGSKKGPAKMDDSLVILKKQLSQLAYVRWEQASEDHRTMAKGKVEIFKIPGGDEVTLALVDEQPDKVTFEVTVVARKAQNKVTVERGQRLVHQVSSEKDGSAFFLKAIVWPDVR